MEDREASSALRLVDVIDNPLPYFAGTVVGAALDLDFGCADVLLEAGIDGLADEGALVVETEVLEEHGGGENLREGVGEVLSCRLRPRSVDGFEEGCVLAERAAGLQAHGACDARGLVGEDVAKGVLGDDDIEETGFGEHAHGGVVDEHVIGFHIGPLGFHLLGYLTPQTAACQHVGLVDDGEMVAALTGHIERHAKDALNLGTGVDVGIVGAVVVLVFLSKVHAARELADDHEVGTSQELVLQGRLVEQAREGGDGTHVGVEAQFLAHGKQSLFGAHGSRGVVVEAQVAHGGEEHGIGTHAHLMGGLRIGVADEVDGMSATDGLLVGELVVELAGDGVHDGHSLLHDLGPDSVAGQNGDE